MPNGIISLWEKQGARSGAALNIKVDDFTGKADMYVLTHGHSDHLVGLMGPEPWSRGDHGGGKIYCTETTKKILMQSKCSVDEGSIQVLHEGLNTVPLERGEQGVLNVPVTVIPDDHCAGSCMFLITFGEDTILHTGDYKYNEDMVKTIREKHESWKNYNHRFRIYIDPTFWDDSWKHPVLKKHNYLAETVKIIDREMGKNPQRKVCLLMSPLGNEKIIKDLWEHEGLRKWSKGKPAPILLDTTQKMDRKHKDAWNNMLEWCDDADAMTKDREDWEFRGGFIEAVPCFGRGRTPMERRILKSIKQVEAKLRVAEREELTSKLEELITERDRLKDVRGSYCTGWNLRSRAHLEIQQGEKSEEDTNIFFRPSTLAFAAVQSRGKEKKFVFNPDRVVVKESLHPGSENGAPFVHRCLYSMHSLRFEHDKLIKGLGSPRVLSGLSGVSAYPFGTILQEAGCKMRREQDDKKWTTEAVQESGEGGLQDGGLGQEDEILGNDKVGSDDSDFTDDEEKIVDDGNVPEVKEESEEQEGIDGQVEVKEENSTPSSVSDLTLDVTADTVIRGSPSSVDDGDVATPDGWCDSVIPETPSPKREGKRSRRR